MTISLINNRQILPQVAPAGEASTTSAGAAHRDLGRGEGSPFASFFRGAMENLEKKNNTVLPLPLTKEEVARLVLKLQAQVNNRLFNILTEDHDDASLSFSGSLAPEIPGVDMPPSEIRRSSPKNGALPRSDDLGQLINQAAAAYGVDPDLVRSVIKAESNFESSSISPKGATGLMQLMPDTARDMGVQNPFDPRENIMGGTRYLQMLLDRYHGNTGLALAAYNWGMGNVEKHYARLPRETRDYIVRVTGYYNAAKG